MNVKYFIYRQLTNSLDVTFLNVLYVTYLILALKLRHASCSVHMVVFQLESEMQYFSALIVTIIFPFLASINCGLCEGQLHLHTLAVIQAP